MAEKGNSVDISCATCQYLIKEDPFYWCGLESGENFYVDVAFDSKPLEIQPEWCLLREKMNNADKFKKVFGMYATELWAMPEEKFVKWLNEEAQTSTISQQKQNEQTTCGKKGNELEIIITIPEEFEIDWRKDRFEDVLHRLSADAHLIAGNYEQETAIMLINAFKSAKIIKGSEDE